ncbi:Cullin repeat-like-containing domain protein [Mycena floridula]|nr:Cullin repeat-like-containing domain protein [Mycena floridula]
MDKPPQSALISASEAWAQIQPVLEECMKSAQPPGFVEYTNVYATLYNAIQGDKHSGLSHVGSEIYKLLEQFLVSNAQNRFLQTLSNSHDEELLESYSAEWERYACSMKTIDGMFSYMRWINPRRAQKTPVDQRVEKTPDQSEIFPVYTLGILSWRTVVFLSIQSRLTKAILRLIERERDGGPVDRTLVKKVVASFVNLGLDHEHLIVPVLDVYRQFFEAPFLQETKSYYRGKTDLSLGDVLEDEEKRVMEYLDTSTWNPLKEILHEIVHA